MRLLERAAFPLVQLRSRKTVEHNHPTRPIMLTNITSIALNDALKQGGRRQPLLRNLSPGSVTSACRRQVPGPTLPVARSGVRIWRAEPIDARHGRAALLERGVAAVDRPV